MSDHVFNVGFEENIGFTGKSRLGGKRAGGRGGRGSGEEKTHPSCFGLKISVLQRVH